MTKPTFFFFQILLIAAVACGTSANSPPGAQLSTPASSPDSWPTTLPELDLPSTSRPEVAPGAKTESKASAPEGLRVIYIRDGDLWSWTEAGGSMKLTDSGDMSTARLSPDGQMLAFMRGREIWTVRMDGADARLMASQAEAGGALWFSPNGTLLAVSTRDHIAVIELTSLSSDTVVTYPAIPGGYYPEIVWSPDAFGFKTVIPPQTETGQAELLFVFTDGTRARLAKFVMLPLTESAPVISPDGGYVIYGAKTNEGNDSLYLMDSSGAARPYGEPGISVRALGWLPDSKRFVYSLGKPSRSFIGNVDGPPAYKRNPPDAI